MVTYRKQGLAYYSTDTDVYQNRKIKRLLKNMGVAGAQVYMYILTEIYRDKGFYLIWDEDAAFDVANALHLEEGDVIDIVRYCVEIALFDAGQLQVNGILTSKSIQERWEGYSLASHRKVAIVSDIEPRYAVCAPRKFDLPPRKSDKTPQKSDKTREKFEESQFPLQVSPEENRIEENRIEENRSNTREAQKAAPSAKRFTPPSPQEVKNYCAEKGVEVDAEAFVDFYESKGWKVGSNAMKDWKAAVRNWARRDKEKAAFAQQNPKTQQERHNDANSEWN